MNKEYDDSLINDLASLSREVFYKALSRISRHMNHYGQGGHEIVLKFAERVAIDGLLNEKDQNERLVAILNKLQLDNSDKDILVASAGNIPSHLLNAISQILSASQRRNLVLVKKGQIDDKEKVQEDGVEVLSENAIVEKDIDCSTVIILSKEPEEQNKNLLDHANLGHIKYDTVEKLEYDLESSRDICAFIFNKSFLQDLSAVQQMSLFKKIAVFSNFVWIRVDREGLKCNEHDVSELIKIERAATSVSVEELSFQSSSLLHHNEISYILRYQEVLSAHNNVKFIPGDIDAEQSRVLVSAVNQHVQELHYSGGFVVISIKTKMLQGGYTNAKLALIQVNKEGKYIVAKIDRKEFVIREIKRFRFFIQRLSNELQPKVFFYDKWGVILFDMIQDEQHINEPAPMLEEFLKDFWNKEVFHKEENNLEHVVKNLCSGIEGIAKKLADLNKNEPPQQDEFEPIENPNMSAVLALLDKGIDWGFERSLVENLFKAKDIFSKLSTSATTHGDIHLRNILIRGGKDTHLIDFEGSGPGHPAVDLVKLELHLFLKMFKATQSEQICTDLQKDINEFSEYSLLESKYPKLLILKTNEVCIKGCISARDSALDVIRKYAGTEIDYFATKYLVAWQSLLYTDSRTSLVRSIINSLAPLLP